MIRITCTHCRQILTIDDGFAGGVCRCQHCGTIQTVPAAVGKTQGRGATPTAKTLYRSGQAAGATHDDLEDTGSGLDELAQIVSSSGLSNSRRLRQKPPGTPPIVSGLLPAAGAHRPRNPFVALVPILVVAAVLIIAAVWLLHRPQNAVPPPQTPSPLPAQVPVAMANFAGMPIAAEDTVVYLLDNGGSANDVLPAMQAACYQSIESLTPQRRFKVLFWRDGSPMYPADGTAHASADELAKCQAALRDVYAQGTTDFGPALKLAIATQPDAIVLITAKGAQLPDDFAQTVLSLRGDSHFKIYTVGINGDSTSDPAKPGVLASLATTAGGQFLNISSADLNRLAH